MEAEEVKLILAVVIFLLLASSPARAAAGDEHWFPMGNITGTADALAVSGNAVYAGGLVYEGQLGWYRVLKWDGQTWTTVGDTGISITALAVTNSGLYV